MSDPEKMQSKFNYYKYKPKQVPIDYSIGVKLLETFRTRDAYPLSHDDTKKLLECLKKLIFFFF